MSEAVKQLWTPAIENLRWRGLRLDRRVIDGIITGGEYLYLAPVYVGDETIIDRNGSDIMMPVTIHVEDPYKSYEYYANYNGDYELLNDVPAILGQSDQCDLPFHHTFCWWMDEPMPLVFWNCLPLSDEQSDIVDKMIADYTEHLTDAGVESLSYIIDTYYDGELDPEWCYEYVNNRTLKNATIDPGWAKEYEEYAKSYFADDFDDLVTMMAKAYKDFLEHGGYDGIISSILPLHEVVDDDGLVLLNRLKRQRATYRTAYLASLPPEQLSEFLRIEGAYA